MAVQYVPSMRRLQPDLERAVEARVGSNELVYMSTSNVPGTTTICLIEADVLREHADLSGSMGGLCAGGGRTLVFTTQDSEWTFVEEGEWIS